MKYYDELLNACHYALQQYHNGHGGQKVPFKKMAQELNAVAPETLRKIAAPNYKDYHPTMRTLEDLRKALHIAAPDYDTLNELSLEAQIDLHSVGTFFEIFDRRQRNRVLDYCGALDADRKYYEGEGDYLSSMHQEQAAAADHSVPYGMSSNEIVPGEDHLNQANSKSNSNKENPDHPELPSERKAD